MKKLIIFFCIAFYAVAASAANVIEMCRPNRIVVGYFNGVDTSYVVAKLAHFTIRNQYRKNPVPGVDGNILHELFYNQSEGAGADIVETYNLRLAEINSNLYNRYELIARILSGKTAWMGKSKKFEKTSLGISFFQSLANGIANNIKAPKKTNHDVLLHQIKIDKYIKLNYSYMFVAHSEGNLFANIAYDYIREKRKDAVIKVLHVAPASSVIHDEYILGDLDLVISALLRTTSNFSTVAKSNWGLLLNREPDDILRETDFLGHGFFEIYNNPNLAGVNYNGRPLFMGKFLKLVKDIFSENILKDDVALNAYVKYDGSYYDNYHAMLRVTDPYGRQEFSTSFKSGGSSSTGVVLRYCSDYINEGVYKLDLVAFSESAGGYVKFFIESMVGNLNIIKTPVFNVPVAATPKGPLISNEYFNKGIVANAGYFYIRKNEFGYLELVTDF